MNRTASKRSSTFTTAQVVQMFMYEADSDEDHDECDDSGTDYDDPLSEVSEYSDTEAADPVVDTHAPVANASNDQTLPSRCGGQRGRKRGRGRGRGGSAKATGEETVAAVCQPLYVKTSLRGTTNLLILDVDVNRISPRCQV